MACRWTGSSSISTSPDAPCAEPARRPRLRPGRIALILALAVGLVGLGPAAVLVWLALEDPFAALPRPDVPAADAFRFIDQGLAEGRLLLRVALDGGEVGEVRAVLSLPQPLPADAIPVVVVLGGIPDGMRTLRQVPPAGPVALVTIDWPVDPLRLRAGPELALEIATLRQQILSAPGQVATAAAWTCQSGWADCRRLGLIGISMGAIAGPAVLRQMQALGVGPRASVLAYGGAGLDRMIGTAPALGHTWWQPAAGWLLGLLLRPVDPVHHLPHLTGRFLLLEGTADRLIPPEAAEAFAAGLPGARRIPIEGEHIGMGRNQRAVLDRVVAEARAWLEEQGVAPPVIAPQAGPAEAGPAPQAAPPR